MPMKRNRLMSLLCVAALFMTGCGSEEPQADQPAPEEQPAAQQPSPERIAAEESPDLASQAAQVSVKQMLALAKAGAWDAFIQGYYGELHKVENDNQLAQLTERFANQWGDKLIPVLEQAAEITPIIEDGKALFQIDGETIYELHLGDNGQWGFHL